MARCSRLGRLDDLALRQERSVGLVKLCRVSHECAQCATSWCAPLPRLRVPRSSWFADPTYRKYAVQLERTVAGGFEHVNEWADFITFLARLLKTLQAYPQYTVIPHKLLIAKRLAQCLNPALPTGVHQRALDVYVHIFSVIGREQLCADLAVWSTGLFPFFQYAATSVRVRCIIYNTITSPDISQPIVLGIYSKFYIPLQEALRPCTRAIILALLPGLEEDTGESFDRVMGLLDQISGTVSPAFFLQNLWLVLLTAPSSRAPALNYLLRRMPQLGPEDQLAPIVGDDVGLMIRAFSSALQDGQLLVQRGTLDLLVTVLPVNSIGFRIDARPEDKILLMRSATGVVLRRDLSLSRRLYAWLLGKSEASEDQLAYLAEFSLDVLSEAVSSSMRGAAEEATRGFKICLSLLDKWEIGAPLTQRLVLGIIDIMQDTHRDADTNEELLLSQKTLFDALDPFLVWRELFRSVREELSASEQSTTVWTSVERALFVLDAFRLQEEEVVRLHLPLLAISVVELLEDVYPTLRKGLKESSPAMLARQSPESDIPSRVQRLDSVVTLLSVAFSRIPVDVFAAEEVQGASESVLHLANKIYAAPSIKEAQLPEKPFGAAQIALTLRHLLATFPRVGHLRLLAELLSRLESHLSVEWHPTTWLANMLRAASWSDFDFLSALVRAIAALKEAKISPVLVVDDRTLLTSLIDRLLFYLQSDHAPHLVEATEALWLVQGMTAYRHVESIICSRLASDDPVLRAAAYDAFGNLWRFTDDAELPGTVLAAPMFMLLDTLRSDSLEVRRAGEAWMRCSLKSYLRVVDPILSLLLPVLAGVEPHIVPLEDGLRLNFARYVRKFDAARVHHVLENLLSLARFGGQGFTRIARSVPAASTHDTVLQKQLDLAGFSNDSYLDAICKTLIAFLGTEPSATLTATLGTLSSQIHATAIELLQVIVSRGDLEQGTLLSCQSTLLARLLLFIQRGELQLQNKVLHVLHAVMQALGSLQTRSKNRRRSIADETADAASAGRASTEASVDPLLPRVLCDGVLLQTDSAVVHHWVDFLLMTAPHFRRSPTQLVLPLIRALSSRIASMVSEFEETYDPTQKGKQRATVSTDADFTVLVNALEKMVVLMVEETRAFAISEEDASPDRQAAADMTQSGSGVGFLGYVTTVLGAGEAASPVVEAAPKAKKPALACLEEAIGVLAEAWEVSGRLHTGEDEVTSTAYILSRVKARSRKALERLYKAQPGEVLESLVLHWTRRSMADKNRQQRLFALLEQLIASPQIMTAHVAERAQARASVAQTDRLRLLQLNPDLSEVTLYAFLQAYFESLDAAVTVQVWPTFLALVKDLLGNPTGYRHQLLPILRCFSTICTRMAQTSALEDRRLRRDLQDNYIRLAEAVVSISARDPETRARTISVGATVGSPLSNEVNGVDEKDKEMAESQVIEPEKRAAGRAVAINLELVAFLAEHFVPGLRLFLVDADKIITICTTAVQQLLAPTLRSRSRISQAAPPEIYHLLQEMTKTPSALRAWRSLVVECFNDARFFDGPPSSSTHWRPIVHALLTAEKERFLELIATVTSAKSANIFANRDLETTLRQTNLRRLSFAILAGDQNRYLTQMPLIQEKLVDLLRSPVGDIVHAEVFLALRVLLLRIGQQHIAGLWPVILAEMVRLFETAAENDTIENRDFLQLVLAACKFIDLLLVLQAEDFQIHQWLFLTDTVDAILPPEGYTPHAVLDRLAEIVGKRSKRSGTQSPLPMSARDRSQDVFQTKRRPLLSDLRAGNIKSLSSLESFFSRVSMSNYEATYACTPIDYAAVEASLDRDMFEAD